MTAPILIALILSLMAIIQILYVVYLHTSAARKKNSFTNGCRDRSVDCMN